ncbi:MAG: gliding motility protein GldM [Chitinophagaceae bacterium]|nr:gliding motility protein GldM [Chitinophagaceae bacterium]
MALPREPRQKMINMMYLVLTALLALNVSSEILNAFKTVNNSLESSVTTVNKSTETVMGSLLEKTTKTESAEKAKVWYPKAQQVQSLTKSLNDYISGLKSEILKRANFDPATGKYKEDNLDIATRLMVEKGEGKTLFQKLTQFKKDILAVDPAIGKEFANSLPIDLSMPPTKNKGNNSWESSYFRMVPTVAALTILSKFQNDVKTSENKVVSYCHEQVGKVEVRFDTYTAIVGQSSNYIMPGQEIEVMAGVGAFSKAAQPTISINGSTVPLGEDGAAHLKVNGGTLGSHTIPVRISYVDQDNKPQTIEKTITYTVGQANASIALDKMNVLYIGVDNPITIAASGGGDDKVIPTITGAGGTIKKIGNGKYIVRVAQQSDDCKISVNVDGKLAGVSQFRVRRIPGAVATIGGFASGENIPAGTFRAQGGVAAWIKDFPFDLKYTVTQFTISTDSDEGDIVEAVVTGNAFDAKARDIINRHIKAGKTVYVDGIRAVGEDGENRKIPSLVYYIK